MAHLNWIGMCMYKWWSEKYQKRQFLSVQFCRKLHAPVMTFCKVLVSFALDQSATWLPEGQPPSSSTVHPRTLSCFCVNIGTRYFYSQNLWISYFWNLMFDNTLPKYEYPGSVLALWEECGIMWGRAQVRGVCRAALNWLFGELSFEFTSTILEEEHITKKGGSPPSFFYYALLILASYPGSSPAKKIKRGYTTPGHSTNSMHVANSSSQQQFLSLIPGPHPAYYRRSWANPGT